MGAGLAVALRIIRVSGRQKRWAQFGRGMSRTFENERRFSADFEDM
jgi:hypothetical protein